MKKIVMFAAACAIAVSGMAQVEKYVIRVVVNTPGETEMEFNDWGVSEGKRAGIVEGQQVEFTGELQPGSYPRSGSLSFVNGSSRRGNLIVLEPGVIHVVFDRKGVMTVSGTPENENLNRINLQTRQSQQAASSAFYRWQRAYGDKAPKDTLEKLQLEIDAAKSEDRENSLRLIRENDNFAGLMLLNRAARYETAKPLEPFMRQFERYSNTQQYQFMKQHYEAMKRCTDGAAIRDFTLPDPEGRMISLSEFRGKWVLLDFWYVGCHWCRKLAPNLKEIYPEFKDKLEIISISVDPPKDHARWIEAIREDGMPWVQLNDKTKMLPGYFGVSGYPTLFLIDPQGRGVTMMVGYREAGSLERTLNQYIK